MRSKSSFPRCSIPTPKLCGAVNGESAELRRSPPVVGSASQSKTMIVKSKKASRLVPEGPHVAKLVAVAGKPNDAEPKKVILRFKVEGHDDEVTK